MLEVFLYFVLFVFACLLTRVEILPAETALVLNKVIIYIALPALILVTIPRLSVNNLPWQAIMVPWVILITIAAIMFSIRTLIGLNRSETALIVLMGAFGNTSFLGIPMVSALIGEEGLPVAIVYDQMGSFLALSSIGVVLLAIISASTPNYAEIFSKIIKFPPFISLCLAIVIPWEISGPPLILLERLASLLLPLAILSVASQFSIVVEKRHLKIVVPTLTLKLLVSPALALVLCLAFAWHGVLGQTLVVEAAMGPMISAGILAMTAMANPQNQKVVVAILGWGLIFSFLTVLAWYSLIRLIF